jgi:hypothetical protein
VTDAYLAELYSLIRSDKYGEFEKWKEKYIKIFEMQVVVNGYELARYKDDIKPVYEKRLKHGTAKAIVDALESPEWENYDFNGLGAERAVLRILLIDTGNFVDKSI